MTALGQKADMVGVLAVSDLDYLQVHRRSSLSPKPANRDVSGLVPPAPAAVKQSLRLSKHGQHNLSRNDSTRAVFVCTSRGPLRVKAD